MPPKQRQVRTEQKSALSAMQQLESRSDEQLEGETRNRAAAQAILGARAAERYDAERARRHFRQAIAAARPQERMQLRRMADASLALAERRAGDLKTAVERLGHEAPSGRQLLALRIMGVIAPPKSAGTLARVRGILAILLVVAIVLAIGFGLAQLVALPFGGISTAGAVFLGVLIVAIVLGVLMVVGRRRQAAARARARSARAPAR
jgi:hypothetical protein